MPPKALIIVGAVALSLGTASAFDSQPRWAADRPGQLAQGRQVYAGHCAACHGTDLAGQPRWWEPGPDGLLPAPPHDPTGHTWQHSDRELVELITHSVAAFAPEGYRTAMPAFAGTLSASQIDAVIAYIKSTWPTGIRAYQAAQNPGGPTLASLGGDWVFPPSCGYHMKPETASR
jgi:mono/diheme cytochrome c family protein